MDDLRKSREDKLDQQRKHNLYRNKKASDSLMLANINKIEKREVDKAEKDERRFVTIGILEQ